jgi:GH25 family lysozyme M1 (1,4-beta-N-acetylmuramidase)
MAVGAYHFAACDTDPVKQAEFFLRRLHTYGLRPGDIPPVMDLEYAKKTLPEKGRGYVVEWGEKFMARLLQEMQKLHLKQTPGWYTYPNFGASLQPELSTSGLRDYWFHLARYKGNKAPEARFYPRDDQRPDLVPKGLPGPILWQYSGNGGYPVPGVPGDCDRNVFIGSSGEWQDFLGLDRPVHSTEYPCSEEYLEPPHQKLP